MVSRSIEKWVSLNFYAMVDVNSVMKSIHLDEQRNLWETLLNKYVTKNFTIYNLNNKITIDINLRLAVLIKLAFGLYRYDFATDYQFLI